MQSVKPHSELSHGKADLLKGLCLLCILLFVLPCPALAADVTLMGSAETGLRSTVDDFEDEDEADDYTYTRFSLRLKQKPSDIFTYDIYSTYYDKNYKTEDSLDNHSVILKGSALYYVEKSAEGSTRFRFNLKYKEKRFDTSPQDEYDQVRIVPSFTVKKKDTYTINLSAGIDNFNYLAPGEEDQTKIFAKIMGTRYLYSARLKLTASYKIDTLTEEEKDREKTKHDVMGGVEYKFELPWIYKAAARAKWGQRDTKEDDERDVDSDYEYWLYSARTEHKITPRLKTSMKYQYYRKDYVGSDLDHKGFYVRNGWRYVLLDDKNSNVRFTVNGEYKDVDYSQKPENSYQKEILEIKANYRRKKDWKAGAALKGDFYDYDDPARDKNRYTAKISVEKVFMNGNLVLSAYLTYKYTDYDRKNDDDHASAKAAFKYQF